MEDTQDKVRRNVVTLSALIIAYWFLDLKVSSDVSLFGIASLGKVSQLKLWICVTLSLLYLFLRYRFDEQTKQQLHQVHLDRHAVRKLLLEPLLHQEFERFVVVRSTTKVLFSFSGEPLQAAIGHRLTLEASNLELRTALVRTSLLTRSGEVNFTGKLRWKYDEKSSANSFNCDYRISRARHVGVVALTIFHFFFYSKSSVDVITPFVLSTAAFVICLSNVIHAT
ncbi:hypothetical protein EGT07_18260 [Herbaspirillum sp. HC18]|nr:hypothetical protein EGT07_18260 [Herbaspirillum sp. HC18]